MTAFNSADGLALRRAVCAAPDDDLPRLVLADYLDEHGDAADADRAAFVRAQCEMEGVPYMSERWRALSKQEQPLWSDHRQFWEAELSAPGQFHKRFRRGFIEDVTVGMTVFVERADALFAATPIRGVRAGDMTNVRGIPLGEFLAAAPVAKLRRLDLQINGMSAWQFPALAAAGHLAGLEALTLPYSESVGLDFGGELPRIVEGLPGLTALQLVRYSGTPQPADAALLGLAESPASRRLHRLDLSGVFVGLPGVVALTGSAHFRAVTRLDLADCRLSAASVQALAVTKSLTALEVLDLSGNATLTDDDVHALAGAAFAPTLKVLVVRRCGLSRANTKRFAGLFPHAEVVV